MEKLLFQGMSAEERLSMLKDNCDTLLEDYSYDKPLSKDELKSVKDQLAGATIDLHDVQEEKKEADRDFNSRIKDCKAVISEKVKQLKDRTTFACELCFAFLERDEAKVYIYNKDGQLIQTRPATMKEMREQNIFKSNSSNKKEAANG